MQSACSQQCKAHGHNLRVLLHTSVSLAIVGGGERDVIHTQRQTGQQDQTPGSPPLFFSRNSGKKQEYHCPSCIRQYHFSKLRESKKGCSSRGMTGAHTQAGLLPTIQRFSRSPPQPVPTQDAARQPPHLPLHGQILLQIQAQSKLSNEYDTLPCSLHDSYKGRRIQCASIGKECRATMTTAKTASVLN